MKIVADTNILLRYFVGDDPVQFRLARETMQRAEIVVVTNQALCEMIWVLHSRYSVSRLLIEKTILQLRETNNIVLDAGAVEAGVAMLRSGADFADGVIAYEGAWMGGETFVSFDKKAVGMLVKQGRKAELLG
jgi:predicted nucleic-acid-binding protein